jgi:hypothetical protein
MLAIGLLCSICCRSQELEFGQPVRVYGNGSRAFGGVYADAFYAVTPEGRAGSYFFGTPGITHANTSVLISENSGQTWNSWYQGAYVDPATGYPFTAVHNNNGSQLHNFGSACASTKGEAQSAFNSSSIGVWIVDQGHLQHVKATAAVDFKSLPVPLRCTQSGVTADCFWLHAGGTVKLSDGSTLLTNCVPWLGGRFGATKAGAGIFMWHSRDGLQWQYRSTVASAVAFPSSGEGPNENDVALLADGRTLLVVMRIDDGVDGGKVGAIFMHGVDECIRIIVLRIL